MYKIHHSSVLAIAILTGLLLGQTDEDEGYKKEPYNFPTKNIRNLEADFSFGYGALTLSANRENSEISGVIYYNPKASAANVDFETSGSMGMLDVRLKSQEDEDDFHISVNDRDFPFKSKADRFGNEIDFQLPPGLRTELDLDFNMGSATLDLTDIRVTELKIDCGLSDVDIVVEKRNRTRCKILDIENGLGDLNAIGLGNLKAQELNFDIGLGSATVDLRGEDIEDMEISVEVGLGSLNMTLPEESNTRIYIDDHFLSSVSIRGLVQKENHEWVSPNWKTGRPIIKMDLSVGLGSVDVVLKN